MITIIEKEEWSTLSAGVTSDIYEGLLDRNAQNVKGGPVQYFTPLPLIEAMMEMMQTKPGDTVADPACGTGSLSLGVIGLYK